jgi:hypothetical protein
LVDVVVTADAMQTQRAHARFLRQVKHAHFIFPVLENQPGLFTQLDRLDWKDVPVTAWTVDRDRGRHELRTIQVLPTPPGLRFPHVGQVFLIERTVTHKGKTSYQAMLYVTSDAGCRPVLEPTTDGRIRTPDRGDTFITRPVHQRVNDMFEHDPVRNTATVAAQRVVGMKLATVGQQRVELDPDGFQQR